MAGDAKLPVNEGKAEHQLAHTRQDETQVERAGAQFTCFTCFPSTKVQNTDAEDTANRDGLADRASLRSFRSRP